MQEERRLFLAYRFRPQVSRFAFTSLHYLVQMFELYISMICGTFSNTLIFSSVVDCDLKLVIQGAESLDHNSRFSSDSLKL